jgi:hypothetical protein
VKEVAMNPLTVLFGVLVLGVAGMFVGWGMKIPMFTTVGALLAAVMGLVILITARHQAKAPQKKD